MGLKLPSFIVIGAEKSGTTWLKHNLTSHPELYVPPQKELHYFDKDENYKKGLSWYSEFFKNAEEPHLGEITPGYLVNYNLSAQRIKNDLPEVKLIAILRNPIDRAWSNYNMNKADGYISKSFGECIEENHFIIQKGHYKDQIAHYISLFEDNLLVLNYDQIKSNPHQLLKTIFDFLEVDKSYKSPKAKNQIFKARKSRWPLLNSLLYNTYQVLKRLGLKNVIGDYKKRIKIWLKKNNTTVSEYNPMKWEDRRKLVKVYKSDIQFLENLWQTKLDHWKE